MDNAALQNYLVQLFERYEIELEPDEDWLLTDGDFPAIRASWHEATAGGVGRLDIDVVLSEERQIEDSFAASGVGAAGCHEALASFERSALHVLLAACWYVTDDRKLRLAAWDIGMRSWDVFIGPLLVQGAEFDVLPELTEALAQVARDEALTAELHWIRLFCRRGADGVIALEALLDNEPWPAGERMLKSIAWPVSTEPYSARCFVALDVRDY